MCFVLLKSGKYWESFVSASRWSVHCVITSLWCKCKGGHGQKQDLHICWLHLGFGWDSKQILIRKVSLGILFDCCGWKGMMESFHTQLVRQLICGTKLFTSFVVFWTQLSLSIQFSFWFTAWFVHTLYSCTCQWFICFNLYTAITAIPNGQTYWIGDWESMDVSLEQAVASERLSLGESLPLCSFWI